MLDEIRSGKPKFAESERSHDTAAIDNIFPVALEKTTNKEIPLSRSETNGNDDDFFVRGVASAGLDSRTMRVLEARVYDLIKEVLDVDSMNVVRRNFVSLLRQSVRLFFSTTLKQWASAQAKVIFFCFNLLLYF